ncbi:hypothetical protein K443DRAFT_11224 [Laccaria amethystina LaAM-08-1]|uniref:Uncharacterized protein n=1 Tax=Laccaria amethystina LaAM-08-1 TaxID=1095629 RepID=A0A0C9X330_9AGAR|nr:hypothetical protein K443DRAFT_11224 [Laccaria amethystina LaAM-08-1]
MPTPPINDAHCPPTNGNKSPCTTNDERQWGPRASMCERRTRAHTTTDEWQQVPTTRAPAPPTTNVNGGPAPICVNDKRGPIPPPTNGNECPPLPAVAPPRLSPPPFLPVPSLPVCPLPVFPTFFPHAEQDNQQDNAEANDQRDRNPNPNLNTGLATRQRATTTATRPQAALTNPSTNIAMRQHATPTSVKGTIPGKGNANTKTTGVLSL